MNLNILRFETLGSTNTEAIDQAKRGADEGLCILSREQTDGRGRRDRGWVSEKDAGLYFSILLRPHVTARYLPLLTLMTAVAVSEALEKFGLETDIKWPNDLLVKDKKISGILAEMTETPTGRAVIVGIGINLKDSAFSPEIADTATSLEGQLNRPTPAEDVLQSVTRSFSDYYDVFSREDGSKIIRQNWAKRSSYSEDKPVRVVTGSKVFDGTTRGIDENGALRVQTADGSMEVVHAGDVERLRGI